METKLLYIILMLSSVQLMSAKSIVGNEYKEISKDDTISCDFEKDLCGYRAKFDKFQRWIGPSPSNTSGPNNDFSGEV